MPKLKKHIVIVGEEPAGAGGVKSTIQNIKEMFKRGYHVTVITGSHKKFSQELESAKITFASVEETDIAGEVNFEGVTLVKLPSGLSGKESSLIDKQTNFLTEHPGFQENHKKRAIEILEQLHDKGTLSAILYTQSLEREERWIYDQTLQSVFKFAEKNKILLSTENRPNTIQSDEKHPKGLQTQELVELHKKVDRFYVRGGKFDSLEVHSEAAAHDSLKSKIIAVGYKSEIEDSGATNFPQYRPGGYWHRTVAKSFFQNPQAINAIRGEIGSNAHMMPLQNLDAGEMPGLFFSPGGTWRNEYLPTYENLIQASALVAEDESLPEEIRNMKWRLAVPENAPANVAEKLKQLADKQKNKNVEISVGNIPEKEFTELAAQSLVTVTYAGSTPIKLTSLKYPPSLLVTPRIQDSNDMEQVLLAVTGHYKGAFPVFFNKSNGLAEERIEQAKAHLKIGGELCSPFGELTILGEDRENGAEKLAVLIKSAISRQRTAETGLRTKSGGAKNLVKDLSKAIYNKLSWGDKIMSMANQKYTGLTS